MTGSASSSPSSSGRPRDQGRGLRAPPTSAHKTTDTYPLSEFRRNTSEHVARISEGAIETITQNGYAAMIVMSPECYDFLVHAAERGHIWREAIRAYRAGERGVPAEQAIQEIADELGVEM